MAYPHRDSRRTRASIAYRYSTIRDGEIVAARAAIGVSTGRAACDPIPANLAPHLEVIENPELAGRRGVVSLWYLGPL